MSSKCTNTYLDVVVYCGGSLCHVIARALNYKVCVSAIFQSSEKQTRRLGLCCCIYPYHESAYS